MEELFRGKDSGESYKINCGAYGVREVAQWRDDKHKVIVIESYWHNGGNQRKFSTI